LYGVSKDFDLALVRLVSDKPFAVAKIVDRDYKAALGDDMWVSGYPLAMFKTITFGNVGDWEVTMNMWFRRFSANIAQGSSGGGCYVNVDGQYELIGVTSMKIEINDFMNDCVWSNDIYTFLDNYKEQNIL
jgi:S1-C subfamily serine protease